MANPEHLAILKEGVEAWNQWRKSHREIEANLIQAKLKGANLARTNLVRANLGEARLARAKLLGANLFGAKLKGANLARADLTRAIFVKVSLDGANLHSAMLEDTVFTDVDLSSVTGLDSVRHTRPSSIGIDTIVRSKGNIPDIFLRGAGVPEPFITNMKALIGAMDPIQFYSCFISYSTKDQDFADRLYADLQAKGVRCWFAPHDIQGGRKIHEQIDEAIRLHDKLLLILSPHSMESEWVKTEISKARKREVRDKARVLFPISLAPFEDIRDWEAFDADTGKDSAREIREYFIPDFSNWKDHDSYQKAFDRLMRDLKANPEAPAHTRQ
jgi:TIR domain/Pentapeptide repeats (8 copies)